MATQVFAAMSGGVDSSVAAALLVDEGYEVIGVTLKLWGGESDSGCCSISDVTDARRVANSLGIEHHVFNFGEEFERHVIDPYVSDHQVGRTPNPCIECNRHIKFEKLFRRADALGVELIATGHHAQILDDHGVFHLSRGADASKDQSYVLFMLTQQQLRRVLLPIGSMTKDRVREIAAGLGLQTANKPDSQDVCFIHSSEGRAKFLGERIDFDVAELVDEDGNNVGAVEAVQLVTIGQRKGLGLGGDGGRRYVVDVDHGSKKVRVGPREQLMVSEQFGVNVVWAHTPLFGQCEVQVSAHGKTRAATVMSAEAERMVRVVWDQPSQRVAAGQSMVFYQENRVVGGATAAAIGDSSSSVPASIREAGTAGTR